MSSVDELHDVFKQMQQATRGRDSFLIILQDDLMAPLLMFAQPVGWLNEIGAEAEAEYEVYFFIYIIYVYIYI